MGCSNRQYQQQRASQSTRAHSRHRLWRTARRNTGISGRVLDGVLETAKRALSQKNTTTRTLSTTKDATTGKRLIGRWGRACTLVQAEDDASLSSFDVAYILPVNKQFHPASLYLTQAAAGAFPHLANAFTAMNEPAVSSTIEMLQNYGVSSI